jgi:hypothetical protein
MFFSLSILMFFIALLAILTASGDSCRLHDFLDPVLRNNLGAPIRQGMLRRPELGLL